MILKPNKYLRELGIDENYWLFSKSNQGDPRYVPDEEGFVDAEHFNLDTSLSLYIYSQLCYFRDYPMTCGTPMGMTHEQWENTVNAMIEAFRLLIIEEDYSDRWIMTDKQWKQQSKNKRKKINYGLRMFIKYYNNLWY
jgi:hypothetical protein